MSSPAADHAPLRGRTAIVTGSGRNIGKAIALRFASLGANIVLNGHRDRAALDAVAAEAMALGAEALVVLADVGNPEEVAALARAAEERFGGIDIAVSNVAVRRHQPFLDISVEDWRRTLDTNLSAAFYLARESIPSMQRRRWGRLIHISGLDGFTGHYPDRAHNVVCKSGVQALAKAIAREFGRSGITANTVAPGAIDTIRDWSQYPNYRPDEVVKDIAVGRIGRVEDVAAACAFLASEEASFITGQTVHVNGGQYMF